MATAAAELFARQGYEQTTVAQIAASAGVTEMTFFRYFPAKEDAIISDPYDPLIAEAAARQPAELGPVIRVVRGMRTVWRDMPEEATALVRTRLRIVAGTPSLRAGTWRAMSATEHEIAGALIATGTDPLAARAAAAAVLAAAATALFAWAQGTGDLREMVEQVLALLDPAVEADEGGEDA